MKSVDKETISELIINKSRFITILCFINDLGEIDKKLEYYKNLYKDATHYCTAYILNSYSKCSDDGEPSGTAGMPILNVLKNNNMDHILCIVVRYFGGIKLGAGGLIRAYSKSASQALNIAKIVDLQDGFSITIEFDYNDVKYIDYYLTSVIINKSFNEKIIYNFKISIDEYQKIEEALIKKAKIVKKEPILITT